MRTATQPVFFGSGAWACAHDGQERTSWTQPASNSRQDTRLLGNGQVDQRVQANYSIESAIVEGDGCHIRLDELGTRHESTRSLNLAR